MRKLYFEKLDKIIVVKDNDHKHISQILRSKIGDNFTVVCGNNHDYIYTISDITRNETVLKYVSKQKNRVEPNINITLFSPPLKGDKNETVIRSCTELGIKSFCPIITDFVAARKESYKVDRLQKIALEALKQSGRSSLPKVHEIVKFSQMLVKLKDFDLVVFLYEEAGDKDIKTFLREKFADSRGGCPHPPVSNIAIIVGGEGGFSKAEVELLKKQNATPITLGTRILRADTAAITACSLVLYEAGEMS